MYVYSLNLVLCTNLKTHCNDMAPILVVYFNTLSVDVDAMA